MGSLSHLPRTQDCRHDCLLSPNFFARGLNFQIFNTITIPRSILILHLNSTNNNTTLIYTFLAFTDSTYVVPTPTHRQPSAGIFLSFVHSWHICTVLTPTIFCRILSLTAHTSFRHRHTDNLLQESFYLSFTAGTFAPFRHRKSSAGFFLAFTDINVVRHSDTDNLL